jgi:hypothetical protein
LVPQGQEAPLIHNKAVPFVSQGNFGIRCIHLVYRYVFADVLGDALKLFSGLCFQEMALKLLHCDNPDGLRGTFSIVVKLFGKVLKVEWQLFACE